MTVLNLCRIHFTSMTDIAGAGNQHQIAIFHHSVQGLQNIFLGFGVINRKLFAPTAHCLGQNLRIYPLYGPKRRIGQRLKQIPGTKVGYANIYAVEKPRPDVWAPNVSRLAAGP